MPTLPTILGIAAVLATSPVEFEEVNSWRNVPTEIRNTLGEMADAGEAFNATDVVDGKPARRFLAAGRSGPAWIVAFEQGGRGYNVQVFQFCSGREVHHWILTSRPKDWAGVLGKIAPEHCEPSRADGA